MATNDSRQLFANMPEAKALVSLCNNHMAPAVWALVNGTEHLALMDCDHKWWGNPTSYPTCNYCIDIKSRLDMGDGIQVCWT